MTPVELKEKLDRAWMEFAALNELHRHFDGKAYHFVRDLFYAACMTGMDILGGPALYVGPPQPDHEELCRQAGINARFAG